MFICHTFICWILNFKAYLAPRVLVREPWHTLIRLFWATLTSCKPLRQQDQTSQSHRKSTLNIHWKDWWWSWSSSTLTTWFEELTPWKRPWCWERLKTGGEGDDRGWDGCMASPTRWTWVWASLGSWGWTGKPGMLQSMGSQRVRNRWATKLSWIYFYIIIFYLYKLNK